MSARLRWSLCLALLAAGCDFDKAAAEFCDARGPGFCSDVDAGPDASADAGSDAGSDAGPDAGSDAGSDAGFDAGVLRGPPQCPALVAPIQTMVDYTPADPAFDHFYGIWGASPAEIWVAGNFADGGALLARTTDQFFNVVPMPYVGGDILNAVHGVAANDAWAVGYDGGVWHWDGGIWTPVDLGPAYRHANWEGVLATPGAVWLAGGGAVLNALDGGLAVSGGYSYDLAAVGPSLYVAGDQAQQALPPHASYESTTAWTWYSVSATTPDDLWFAGQHNNDGGLLRVVRAPDGGLSAYPPVGCPGFESFNAVVVTPGGDRWVAGSHEVVLHGVGDGFEVVNNGPGSRWIWGGWFDGTHVWFVGSQGMVMRTP